MAAAAAVVGRLLFVALVVNKAVQSSSPQAPRVLLHFGMCTPAAITTYLFLKSTSAEIMATVSRQLTSQIPLDASLHLKPFVAEEYDVWSFSARKWAVKGIDLAFDFSEDTNVADETIGLLSARGVFVQTGGSRCYRANRSQQHILVDYMSIAEDDVATNKVFDTLAPTLFTTLMPAIESYEVHQFSLARAKAFSSKSANIAILLDFQHVDPELPVLKGGVIRGTAAFNPRASYVVIGGIGGLGASIARFLVENGARHVVLTSRSGENVSTRLLD